MSLRFALQPLYSVRRGRRFQHSGNAKAQEEGK